MHKILEIQTDFIKRGTRIVIVDDLLATGGTANAAGKLINKLGANLLGYACIIDRSDEKISIKDKIVSQMKFKIETFSLSLNLFMESINSSNNSK